MRRLVYIFLVISIIFGCKSLQKNKPDGSWDFEKFMVEAKRFANNGKYQSAIDILRDSIVKFPNEDVIPINYNIGFNFYKMKKYDDAKSYLNAVIKMYEEKEYSEAQRMENKKFVVLSTLILDKIKSDIEEQKDPYHIQEDLDKNKVIKPKK